MPYIRIPPGGRKIANGILVINTGDRPIKIWIGPVDESEHGLADGAHEWLAGEVMVEQSIGKTNQTIDD